MGKSYKKKIAEFDEKEAKFKESIAIHSNKIKMEKLDETDIPLIEEIDEELLRFAVNNPKDFKDKSKSKNRDKKLLTFAKFIFVKYKTPKILDKVWASSYHEGKEMRHKNININYRKWFVCAATGGSIYKSYLKSFLTKKEAFNFINCPFDLDINQALIYAIALSESENVGVSLKIAKSKINEKDYENVFWKNVIKFFSQENKTPDKIDDINDLVDFLNSEYDRNPNFNIFGNGWTLQSITKRMHDWHYNLNRAKKLGSFTWEGHEFKNFSYIKREDKIDREDWVITQIKSSKELLAEGSKQHHCVFGYKNYCIKGITSIWSLKMNNKRKVTIEVKSDGRIVQARGFANKKTTGEEDNIIRMWAKENNLQMSYIY